MLSKGNKEKEQDIRYSLFERDIKKFQDGSWLDENAFFINEILNYIGKSTEKPTDEVGYWQEHYENHFFVYSPFLSSPSIVEKGSIKGKRIHLIFNEGKLKMIAYDFSNFISSPILLYQWTRRESVFYLTINFIKYLFLNSFDYVESKNLKKTQKINYNHVVETSIPFALHFNSHQLTFDPLLQNPALVCPKYARKMPLSTLQEGPLKMKEHLNEFQEFYLHHLNPWNLFSIVKANNVQYTFLLEYLEEIFTVFESKLLLFKEKLIQEEDKNFDGITDKEKSIYREIFLTNIKQSPWLFNYENQIQTKHQLRSQAQDLSGICQLFNLSSLFFNQHFLDDQSLLIDENSLNGYFVEFIHDFLNEKPSSNHMMNDDDQNIIRREVTLMEKRKQFTLSSHSNNNITTKTVKKFLVTDNHHLNWFYQKFSIKLFYDKTSHVPSPQNRTFVHVTEILKINLKKIHFEGFDTYEALYDEMVTYVPFYKKSGKIEYIKRISFESRVFKWWYETPVTNILEDMKFGCVTFIPVTSEEFITFIKTKVNTFSIDTLHITHYMTFIYSITLLSCIFTKYQLIIKEKLTTYAKKSKQFTNLKGIFTFDPYFTKEGRDFNQKIYESCHLYMTAFFDLTEHFYAVWPYKDQQKSGEEEMNLMEKGLKLIQDKHVPISLVCPYVEKIQYWTKTNSIDDILGKLDFWTMNNDNVDGLLSLFCKALPFRYQGRSIDKKVLGFCLKQPAMRQFILTLIKNTIFGNYQDNGLLDVMMENNGTSETQNNRNQKNNGGGGSSKISSSSLPLIYRSSFITMFYYYHLFFKARGNNLLNPHSSRNNNSKNAQTQPNSTIHILLEWILDESNMTSLILREFLCFVLSSKPQYQITQTVLHWTNTWFKTIVSLNLLRNFVDQHIKNDHFLNGSFKLHATSLFVKPPINSGDKSLVDLWLANVKSVFLPKLSGIKNYFTSASSIFCTHAECFKNVPQKTFFLKRLFKDLKKFYNDLLIEYVLIAERTFLDDYKENVADRRFLDEFTKDLNDKHKNIIWLFFMKKLPTKQLLHYDLLWEKGIYNFLSSYDGYILFVICELYHKNIKYDKLKKIFMEFSISSLKTLLHICEVLLTIRNYGITIDLPLNFTQKIDRAMMKKFNLMSEEEIINDKQQHENPAPDSIVSEITWNLSDKLFTPESTEINKLIFQKKFRHAFLCYETMCCRSISNYSLYHRIYGHKQIIYDPINQILVCARKRVKKTDEEKLSSFNIVELINPIILNKTKKERIPNNNTVISESQKQSSYELFSEEERKNNKIKEMIYSLLLSKPNIKDPLLSLLPLKNLRKIVRRLKDKPFDCANSPPVFTTNLYHKGLIVCLSSSRKQNYSMSGPTKNLNDGINDSNQNDQLGYNMFIHCPRCANIHLYCQDNWYGEKYMCLHCLTEVVQFSLTCSFCEKTKSKVCDTLNNHFKFTQEISHVLNNEDEETVPNTSLQNNSIGISSSSFSSQLSKKSIINNEDSNGSYIEEDEDENGESNEDDDDETSSESKISFSPSPSTSMIPYTNFVDVMVSYLQSIEFDYERKDIRNIDDKPFLTNYFQSILKPYTSAIKNLWERGQIKNQHTFIFNKIKNKGKDILISNYKEDQKTKKHYPLTTSLIKPIITKKQNDKDVGNNTMDKPTKTTVPSSNKKNAKLGKYKPKKLIDKDNQQHKLIQWRIKTLVNYSIFSQLQEKTLISMAPIENIVVFPLFLKHRGEDNQINLNEPWKMNNASNHMYDNFEYFPLCQEDYKIYKRMFFYDLKRNRYPLITWKSKKYFLFTTKESIFFYIHSWHNDQIKASHQRKQFHPQRSNIYQNKT